MGQDRLKAAYAGQNAPGTVEAVRAAIVDIDRAHNVATAAVNAADDLTVAMAAASELAAHMQKLTDAELRKQIVSRMWDADKLSLAGLADKVSMSDRRRAEIQEGR